MVQDFIDCAHGSVSGCAWAIGSLAAPAAIRAGAKYAIALRTAIRAGVGLDQALYDLRSSGLAGQAIAGLTKVGREVKLAASGQCFPAGTPIAAEGGTKRIEDIRVGDRIWATNPATGTTQLRRVTHLFRNTTESLVRITADGKTAEATPGHPFWVPGKGWTAARYLRTGDSLQKIDGSLVKVSGTVVENREVSVYNFEVEGDHTYYATDLSVLVHNSCRDYYEMYDSGAGIAAELDAENHRPRDH
jgi:hypothetical protein